MQLKGGLKQPCVRESEPACAHFSAAQITSLAETQFHIAALHQKVRIRRFAALRLVRMISSCPRWDSDQQRPDMRKGLLSQLRESAWAAVPGDIGPNSGRRLS